MHRTSSGVILPWCSSIPFRFVLVAGIYQWYGLKIWRTSPFGARLWAMVGNLTVHVGNGVWLCHPSHKGISKNPAFGVSSKGGQNQQKPRISAKACISLVSFVLLSMEKCPVSVPPIFPAGCSAFRNPKSCPGSVFRCRSNPKAAEKGLQRQQDLWNKNS